MTMDKEYQICTRCVMDTTDPLIRFDENGICNHCKDYEKRVENELIPSGKREEQLKLLVDKMKREGKSKRYDCLIGLSGGVDSTYLAYIIKKMGLRPIAVHLDNGWNSELAVKNIENTVKKLNIDLYTHVIDWEEFKDIQLSYFKASIVDIETPTDHGIWAILYKIAAKYGIKYIINGSNLATESILPLSWISDKNDLRNIKSIHRLFGSKKMKTFPTLGFFKKSYYDYIKGTKVVLLLNYLDYVKEDAMKTIEKKLCWKNYGAKHHESQFTKFFQAYILPEKFNIDKRKAHLSTLICSGQISRDEALEELKKPPYNLKKLNNDKEYVIKKWGLTEESFTTIMNKPIKEYTDYPSYHNNIFYILARYIYRLIKGKA